MTDSQFVVTVRGTAAHHVEDIEEACRQLREDLADLDGIELGEVISGPAEKGTRADLVSVATAILVSYYVGKLVVWSAQDIKRLKAVVMPRLAQVFHDFLNRHKDKRAIVRLPDGTETDLTHLGEDGIRTILEQMVDRSAGASPQARLSDD